MKRTRFRLRNLFLFLLLFAVLWSCKENKSPDFPGAENQYEKPFVKELEVSETDTLVWNTNTAWPADSRPISKFEWRKIPTRRFDIGGTTVPFKESRSDKHLVWDSLPSRDFSFDSLPKVPLKFKVTVLGAPKVVKAGQPERSVESTRGVMTLDEDFGYPGTVAQFLKARNEMIWIGGNTGLGRYDTENILLYDQEQGLRSRNIESIFEDSHERIWVVDDTGVVSILDFKSNLIYELSISFKMPTSYGISETKDGKIWLSNPRNGYLIIDLKNNEVLEFSIAHGLAGNFGISSFQDDKGMIWLSTDKGANMIDLDNGKVFTLNTDQGLLGDFVISFFQDSSMNVWICGEGGVTIVNAQNDEISYVSDMLEIKMDAEGKWDNAVSEVIQSSSGDVWIEASTGNLFRYDMTAGLIEKYHIKTADRNVNFWGMAEDRFGQIWVPTIDLGIFVIDPDGGRPANLTSENGIESIPVWSIIQTRDEKIWMGGINGLDIVDLEKKSISHIGKENGLIAQRSNQLSEDSQGRIWSFGLGVGVNIIDPDNQTIEQFITTEILGNDDWITAFLEDSSGNFWLGSRTGRLFFLNQEKQFIKDVVIDSVIDETDGPKFVDHIYEDEENQIWVSGRNIGIHILDPTHQFRRKLNTENGMISNDVYAFFPDGKNVYWTGTAKGVERIDLDKKEVSVFTAEQGLGANDVYDIIRRGDKIYLGTSNGLTMLSPPMDAEAESREWRAVNYNKGQGLDYLDFNMGSFMIDTKERFWASVESEIVTVIDEIREDTTAQPIFITGINIFDKKQTYFDKESVEASLRNKDSIRLWELNDYRMLSKAEIDSMYADDHGMEWQGVSGPYDLPEGLTLAYDQNYLSFSFNAAQFSNPDKVVYRYLLEGIDKSWSAFTDQGISENYRDLASGDYTFKVAAKGFDGVWSKPAEFSFTILPPWWQTWWAYTIFAALFLGLGLAILHYRSRWLKRENRILEEKVNERTAELKNTIDELENTQSQLIQSEKMASLGELTAGIAHEIQNPMNFINNFSEVTRELVEEMCEELVNGETNEALGLSKDIVQNLDKITHHGKRASSIVKGMLEHSRNSSGQLEHVDINVLADEYLRLAYHGLRAKDKSFNADFKTDFDETLPKVQIIPQDLGRVVLNIINNAFFAVTSIPAEEQPEGFKPLVKVSTKNMGNQVLISIKDNGPGIPEEVKDKIFQPFFTTKPTGKGTGLGLSLAYDIVTTGHGGAIELNTAPGEGTEFVIYIPIRE